MDTSVYFSQGDAFLGQSYYSNLTTNLKVLKMLSVHPSKGLKGAMLKHSAQWPDPSSDPSAICS